MTYALSEPFDDPRGRWNGFAPFDATEEKDGVKGFLTTQEHVDLRSFRVISSPIPVPQSDLEATQQAALDAELQSAMETKPGLNTVDELWSLTATGGTNNDLTVGKIASRGGWSGAHFTTDGTALAATLQSVMSFGIDISHESKLSLILPDFNTFDAATSYIQLCSGGAFGAGHDSAQVLFSSNLSTMPELLLNISAFAQAGFDNTNVTGVRIHLVKSVAPAAGQTITLMALRAVTDAWTESALDFDTRAGIICVPVTLNGAPYAGTVAQNFEFVRGDGSKNDPIPADLAMNMYFYPGGATSPNDATGANYNRIGFLLREKKDTSAGTGSHIRTQLRFNDAATYFEIWKVDTSGGAGGPETDTALQSFSLGTTLDPAKTYVFSVEIKGTQISASVWETQVDRTVTSLLWRLPSTLTDTRYLYRNGRVGFVASLLTRDAYVESIEVAPTGFATMVSQIYNSRTPIDGAQLAARFASDENFFDGVSGPDFSVDQTKTVSGFGSYRTSKSLTTNAFVVDDWTQTYLDLAIWVSNIVTLKNQPQILLNTSLGPETISVPRLQPAQWNYLHFDLGLFRNLLTGVGYSITIQEPTNTDKPLGDFWVDSIVIGRRRVVWSVRATPNGPFRQFKDLVNNPSGAVHFPANERGTALQVKAEALTQDAWISSFKLFPRYAQLGLPVYDQGFETR